MGGFPADIPVERAIRAFEHLGFHLARRGNHIALPRKNESETRLERLEPEAPRLRRWGTSLERGRRQASALESDVISTRLGMSCTLIAVTGSFSKAKTPF